MTTKETVPVAEPTSPQAEADLAELGGMTSPDVAPPEEGTRSPEADHLRQSHVHSHTQRTVHQPAAAAAAILAKRKKGTQRRVMEDAQLDDERFQYFERCRRGHVGIFYTRNPVGRVIDPEDWFSTLKAQDEPWMNAVICQECAESGHENPIEVLYMPPNPQDPSTYRKVRFTTLGRRLYAYPKGAEENLELVAFRPTRQRGETDSVYRERVNREHAAAMQAIGGE